MSAHSLRSQRLRVDLFTPSVARTLRTAAALGPFIDLAGDLFLGLAVGCLDLAFELFAMAGNDIELIVGDAAPLLASLAFELFPVAFDSISVHCHSLRSRISTIGTKPLSA